MLKALKNHIDTNLKLLNNSRLIIGISGGIDSVVLAHLCKKLNLDLALAHCNFNLRGGESDNDEQFVIDLADDLDVEIFVQNFDTEAYANEHKCSIQMAARELRYNWFKELANQLQFDYILTAHHADDNLETFLINFTRGTGLNGLTGIPILNENIVRPLLPFSRGDVESFAKEHRISWREDSSNKKRKYLRNKLRHEVVPILKEINPQLLDSFKNTIKNLNDTADIVEESLNAVAKRAIVNIDERGVTYKISEFKKVNNTQAYLYEMFKDYGFTEWDDVERLLNAQSGKYIKSGTHRLIKHRNYLILSGLKTEGLKPILISELKSDIKTPLGVLCFDIADVVKKKSKNAIYVDAKKFSLPLTMRLWEEGDTFNPIGMKGKKKLSKYLKDERSSLIEKENTWVLTSGKDIIWVVGKRADGRFKVSDATNTILKIELN
ncbi:tRNA lysidine(34) synthetase TilS [Winogradskyella sp.]|uniref:tRNA lysidine(34) synthetase TilS n=1 Tax=Winogradskyella sp. TaxID=1883156 RepID=UPI003F6C20F9